MLSQILDTLDVGVMVQNAAAQIVWSNRMARELLGLEQLELHARSSYDEVWEAMRLDGTPFPAAAHPGVLAVTTGQPVKGVVMGVSRGRRGRVWLLIDAFPRCDASGKATEAVVSFIDVTAQYARLHELNEQNLALEQLVEATQVANTRSIEALQLTESRYRATINAMAEGVAILAPSGGILDANPAAQALLGLSLDKLRRRAGTDVRWGLTRLDGTPMPPPETPVERTATTGAPVTGEVVGLPQADGGLRWLSINTSPIRSGRDSPMMGVVATFSDITRQRDAELEVQASRARLQQMTEAVPGLLFELVLHDDERETFRFLSGASLSILGITPEAGLASASAVWATLQLADATRLRARWRSVRLQPTTFEDDARLLGEPERWTRWRIAPPKREAAGWVLHGLVLDVTQERKLTQTLREAQRQEPLGVLAAGIAHNFNNMLSVILPGLDHARSKVDAQLRPLLDDAHRAAESAATLVRQLMQLVRRDRADDAEDVDALALANEVVSLCRKTFDSRVEVELVTETSGPLWVRGHRGQLQQVLLNLCINARDAMVRSPLPRLTVHVAEADLPRTLMLSVSDTGEGMSEDTSQRLGELFFTTKAPGSGTGLGIATALGIVRDLGGALEWSSTPGIGSTFTVTLPLSAGEKGATPTKKAVPAKRFHGQKVVIIDDEPLVRRALGRQLKLLGLTVCEASNGAQGLAEIDDSVNAVVVDLSMPGMGGEEVVARLQAVRPSLPVFVLSGYVPEGLALNGARAIIHKPFTPEVLEKHLGEALDQALPQHP